MADLLYECRDVMMTKAHESDIQIRIDVPGDMPLMEADRDKIKQVMLNLMSNAVKYNRANGSVLVNANYTETELSIVIQDTGIGIPEEAIPHLFQKFYRVREHENKARGTGLGLSIHERMQHH